jgi:tRNA nucleotidyltransferase (CCA-adding enzyme)
MCHTPGGDEHVSDTGVRRLLRRRDHAGGGPTLKEWSRLVEADKAGRGGGAAHGFDHLPVWLEMAERFGNEKAVSTTILKGPHPAESGIERGSLWAWI